MEFYLDLVGGSLFAAIVVLTVTAYRIAKSNSESSGWHRVFFSLAIAWLLLSVRFAELSVSPVRWPYDIWALTVFGGLALGSWIGVLHLWIRPRWLSRQAQLQVIARQNSRWL